MERRCGGARSAPPRSIGYNPGVSRVRPGRGVVARRACRALAVGVSAAVFAGAPVPARGQVFLASSPHPQFSIGPLFIVATVTPGLGPVAVRLSFSLTLGPGMRAEDIPQDFYLLWPAEVAEGTAPGHSDPAQSGAFTHPRKGSRRWPNARTAGT